MVASKNLRKVSLLALTKKHTIDISSFVEKAKTLGVLGVKVTQHNELKASG